jgi:hypothetical protein
MTKSRSDTIQALERVIGKTKVLLDEAIAVNQLIREKRLSIRQLDLAAIYGTQETAEMLLKEIELRAVRAA